MKGLDGASVLRWLANLWLSSTPAEFESSFGMPESVERLTAATRRSVFFALARQEAVGTVTESHVSLQRVIPMVGNSFKPFYRGHFIESDGKVILVGRFTMHWFVKIFMTCWFGGVGAFMLGAILRGAGLQNAMFALFGLGMMVAGIALVSIGKWFSRNDAAWLSDVIRGALCARALDHPTHAEHLISEGLSPAKPPTTITLVTAALVISAVLNWSEAIFGIRSAFTNSSRGAFAYFPDVFPRYLAAGLGAAMLMLAFGVYRRRLLAWRAGFALLAGGWIYAVAEMLTTQTNRGVAVIFSIGCLAVTVVWALWWRAQRIHFRK
jgi:hypothetical protein